MLFSSSSSFSDFERFYFETKPRLSADIIKVLFYVSICGFLIWKK